MKTEYDVIVVGSGAGGLTAALAAADRGLSTLIIEKADVYGGSTALSGGGVWIPNSPQLGRIGIVDSRESVRGYLDSIVGDHVPSANLDAFIDEGPKMMAFLDRSPHLKFQWCTGYSDYHPENPGGRPEGRSVEPLPFDIRALGEDADLLRSAALATPPGLYITQKDFVQVNMVTRTWKARRQALKTGFAA
ncbi:MAG: FAD-dependent oxidoreductase, partial [Gordonia sp. (in: high G+C Gram-positive bacteria)]|nr:FAD-dependent oxidoreductase [Gordonia sp. (in: high G+C Gram-positive bacteria)]